MTSCVVGLWQYQNTCVPVVCYLFRLFTQPKIMKLCRRSLITNTSCRASRKWQLRRLLSLKSLVAVGIIALCYLYFPKRATSSEPKSSSSHTDHSLKHYQTREGENAASDTEDADQHVTAKSAKEHRRFIPNIHTTCSQFNFSFSSVIVEPDLADQDSNLLLFILIASGVGRKSFLEKRNAIRSTWLGKNNNRFLYTWRHVFMSGRSRDRELDTETRREALRYNDILLLNATDNYQNLIIKVLSGFRWVFERAKPRFILKADDDVYIRLPQLMSWLSEPGIDNLYGGVVNRLGRWFYRNQGPSVRRQLDTQLNALTLDCFPEDNFPPYPAGPFYVISSNSIPSLFQNIKKWKVFPVEDAYMGVLARASGLEPVDVPGFRFDSNLFSHHKCTWASTVALGHNFTRTHLHYIHNKLLETDKLQLSPHFILCVAHESFVILILLVSLVIFLVCVFIQRRRRLSVRLFF